jgi:hypothetical protein
MYEAVSHELCSLEAGWCVDFSVVGNDGGMTLSAAEIGCSKNLLSHTFSTTASLK